MQSNNPKVVKRMDKKVEELVQQIETLTVLQVAELVKALEEKFGVSAATPMIMAAAGPGASGAGAETEEKDAYTVAITEVKTDSKINLIKAIREIKPDLGLKETKNMVENLPVNVEEDVKTEDAKAMQTKLEAAGAKVELR